MEQEHVKKRYRFERHRWVEERQGGSLQRSDSTRPSKRAHPVPIDDASKRFTELISVEEKRYENNIDGFVTIGSNLETVEVPPTSSPRRTNRATETTQHHISDRDENEKETVNGFVTIALNLESVEVLPTSPRRRTNRATETTEHQISNRDENEEETVNGFVTIALNLESVEVPPTSPPRRKNRTEETRDVATQTYVLCQQRDVATQATGLYRQRSVATETFRIGRVESTQRTRVPPSLLELLADWD